jgi:hypothetical protein
MRRYRFLSDADQRRLMIALQNMRMACDSTYLLYGKTDFGLKVDELVTLFEEVSERLNRKVVIFSQWLRMHGTSPSSSSRRTVAAEAGASR